MSKSVRALLAAVAMLILTDVQAAGEPPPPGICPGVRQAKANVKVEKSFYVQEDGNYRLRSETVCTNQATVGVLPGPAANCMYPILATCPIEMDGHTYRINVSGQVYHNDDLGRPTKHFTAGYHLNRNSVEIKTGEASTADLFTADLGLKNIGVRIQSKLDSPHPGMKFRDALNVYVDFEDTDAP